MLKAEAKASGVELRGIALDREGFLDSDGEAVNFEKEFLEHGMLERYISSTASVLEIGARSVIFILIDLDFPLFSRRDALKEQFGKDQTRSDAWP